jgi:GNAT superfamily N-acetyltransferase
MVQPLEPSDVREAASVLGRAFCDNPGVRAILKGDGPEVRLRLTENAMHGFARAILRVGAGEVIKEGGRVSAVSLVYPPLAYPPKLTAELTIASGLLSAGPRRLLRFASADALMRKRHIREPHWYLWVLGVEPERQGQGLGSALLRSLREKAERTGLPCYLETDKPSSVRLYQNHGYVVQREEVHQKLELRLWFMLRRPEGTGA